MGGRSDTTKAPTRAYWLWVGACALGEAVGLVAAGALNAVLAPRLAARGAEPWVLFGLMVVAGAIEGACVGAAQWLALRRALPRVRFVEWTLATSMGFAAGWLVGALAAGVEPAGEPGAAALVGIAAVSGLLLGAAVGLGQALVLWRWTPRPGRWVGLNAAAWTIGMVVSFLGARVLPAGPYDLGSVALGIATGAGVGVAVGAVTGIAAGAFGGSE